MSLHTSFNYCVLLSEAVKVNGLKEMTYLMETHIRMNGSKELTGPSECSIFVWRFWCSAGDLPSWECKGRLPLRKVCVPLPSLRLHVLKWVILDFNKRFQEACVNQPWEIFSLVTCVFWVLVWKVRSWKGVHPPPQRTWCPQKLANGPWRHQLYLHYKSS